MHKVFAKNLLRLNIMLTSFIYHQPRYTNKMYRPRHGKPKTVHIKIKI